jgi:hypothetical protein
MNKTNKNSVGRPYADIVYPRGAFTIKQLHEANPNVCPLTVRKHVVNELDTKFLTLLKDTVKTGKPGKPADKFIRTAVYKGLKSARKARGKTIMVSTVAAEVPVEIPIQNTTVTTYAAVPVSLEEVPSLVEAVKA